MFILSLIALGFGFDTEFAFPSYLRQPGFDVEFQSFPLERHETTDIVSLYYKGVPIECAIPNVDLYESSQGNREVAAILARKYLKPLNEVQLVTLDDTWAWSVTFNRSVVQFLPAALNYSSFSFNIDYFFAKTGQAMPRISDEPIDVFANSTLTTVNDKLAMKTVFDHGYYCDITRDHRKTNIYFVCDDTTENLKPKLLSVFEPHPCTYEMTWGVKELCGISEFSKPVSLPSVIKCGPMRSNDDNSDNTELYERLAKFGEEPKHHVQADIKFVGKMPV